MGRRGRPIAYNPVSEVSDSHALNAEGPIKRQGWRKPIVGIRPVSLAMAGSAEPLKVPRLSSERPGASRWRRCAPEHMVDFGAGVCAALAGLTRQALVLDPKLSFSRRIPHGLLALVHDFKGRVTRCCINSRRSATSALPNMVSSLSAVDATMNKRPKLSSARAEPSVEKWA